MFRTIVEELLETSLSERKDLFLTEFEILSGNKIRIVIHFHFHRHGHEGCG